MQSNTRWPGNDLVSVIVPSHNRATLVLDALRSVHAQTYRPLQLIVVDDGSTDGTRSVIRQWAARNSGADLQVVYCYQANSGGAAARNHGIGEAAGDWIKFLDSDDVLHRSAIARQVNRSLGLTANQIVFGDLGVMDAQGQARQDRHYQPPRSDQDTFTYLLEQIVNTPTPLHRRSALNDVGGFREHIIKGQELDLHLRLALAGIEFVYHPGVVAYKRIHDSKMTNKFSIESHPEVHIKLANNKLQLSLEYFVEGIPPNVRDTLARGYWALGREFARARMANEARMTFGKARDIGTDMRHYVVGSAPYRWLAYGLGGVKAELVLATIKNLPGKQLT